MSETDRICWREWLKAAGIRAVKTFAQALIACLPVTAATIGSVDWGVAISTAALAAVLSMLTSLAGLPEAVSPIRQESE